MNFVHSKEKTTNYPLHHSRVRINVHIPPKYLTPNRSMSSHPAESTTRCYLTSRIGTSRLVGNANVARTGVRDADLICRTVRRDLTLADGIY